MAAFTDLNGIWSGSYGYPDRERHVSFTAWLDDQAGAIGGSILEPNTFVDTLAAELAATISGARSGTDLTFSKTYDPGQGAHNHTIQYSGRINSDFTWIVGRWRIAGWFEWSGPFEMARQSGALEKAQRKLAVETVS